MKKILTLLIAIMMMLSIAACGGAGDSGTTTGGGGGGGGTTAGGNGDVAEIPEAAKRIMSEVDKYITPKDDGRMGEFVCAELDKNDKGIAVYTCFIFDTAENAAAFAEKASDTYSPERSYIIEYAFFGHWKDMLGSSKEEVIEYIESSNGLRSNVEYELGISDPILLRGFGELNSEEGKSPTDAVAWDDNAISRMLPASIFYITDSTEEKGGDGEVTAYNVTVHLGTTIEQFKAWVADLEAAGFSTNVLNDAGADYYVEVENDSLYILVHYEDATISMSIK